MAEYRIQFAADTSAAGRSINDIQKAISQVRLEFTKAEISSKDFADTASELSRLQKELKDASSAVVDIDRAYRQLNKAIEANSTAYERAGTAAVAHHKKLIGLAEESFKQEDILRDKNFKAELADYDRRLNAAAAARKKMVAQQRAIMQFRAGMGERNAIPGVASPVGGAYNISGSPLFEGVVSLASLERKLEDLRKKSRLITPRTTEWRSLNDELLKTERAIDRVNKMQRRGPTAGQRAGAAGGAFLYGGGLGGGVGSAVGGIAGGLAGGVPGAFVGAAVGQAVDSIGASVAGLASQAATVQQLQRGLAMASVDARDFAEAQAAVGEMSGRILMPMEQTLRMFTQLRVNTKQYNLSVAETAQIMEGTALAIQSTGGSAQDMEGAMRAVVQIMSKGGVQAEELRGQLGERFPGAVVKFAQANKMSFEELQEALERGEVGIAEFVNFAQKNYSDYAQFSQQLATAPEFAGQRLAIAFEQMRLVIGSTMGDAGAIIQDAVTGFIKDITQFVKENESLLRKMYSDFAQIFSMIIGVVRGAVGIIRGLLIPLVDFIQGIVVKIQVAVGMAGAAEYAVELKRINDEIKKVEASGDARSFRRLAELKEERAATEAAYKNKGGDAALRGPAMSFGGPGAGMSTERGGASDAAEKARKEQEREERARQSAIDQAQRDAERGADQQRQLITATAEFQNKKDELRFQHLETLYSGELDHAMAMIDAKHDYELAGANEINARQLRYYKEQKDIQLRNLRSVRDAMTKMQDAQMRLEAARRSKAAVERAASIMPAEGAPAAGGGGNANLTGYLTRLSYLETRLKNVPNAEGSGAMGFFQTKGPFHGEATAASGGKNSRSSNFAEASQAVASWIEKHRPEAYSAILGGQFDKADAILRVGTWPSLPGGSQAQPSAVQAQARQYLPGGALAAPSAPALPASRPMPSLKKGGVFQGFPVTGVPGEDRAYRGGIHEGYDVATPMNTALSYAIGGIVKRIDKVGKGNIGKMVEVELENGVIGFSGHLNEVLVQVGQRFAANQIIARTGDTGAGGIHLHQESAPFGYKKGRAAESMAYLQLGGARVPGAAASGPRHSMAKAGQEASFDVELAKLELANVKAENIKKVIQELSIGSEQLRASLAAQVAEVFPVKQMELEAALMEERNQLVMAGAPSEYIEAQQSIAKGDMERVVMLQYMTERLGEIKAAQEGFAKEIAKGGPYVDFFKGQLKDAEDSAKLYEDAIAGAGAEQQRFNLLVLEGALAELKNADALKAMQEAVGMVKSAVEGVMGSYKNFLGEVLKGGSLKDAAKQLQEALRDQAVTMFLDFAMKPMQKFLEDSLLKVFGLESEEQQRQKSIALLSQIRDNTAQGGTGTNPGTTAVGGTGASDFIPLTGGLGRAAVDAPFGVDVRSMVDAEEGIRATSESMYQLGATMPALGQGVGQLTQSFAASAAQSGAAAKTWQASLGATVQSIGMAAGAVMSIAGGASQIKEGGVSGVLGGIGSIFMGIGGALGGLGGAGGLGSLFGGGSSFASNIPFNFASAPNIFGQLAMPGFANGGIVNGPTLGLVGEGKYNEAIVPLPDGRSIPVKMAGGQSAREAMSNGGMPFYAPSTVSFSFESTKINGVEYVSRDQLELAMASTRREAIKEGAKRGMGMTLDKIQQSPGTRRSIAMGRR